MHSMLCSNSIHVFVLYIHVHVLISLSVCFVQTVSEGCSEQTQCSALSVIHLASEHSPYARHEFESMNGIKLIQQVLRSSKACVNREMVGVSQSCGCQLMFFLANSGIIMVF